MEQPTFEHRPAFRRESLSRYAVAAVIIVVSFACNLLVVTQSGEATGRSLLGVAPGLTNSLIRQSQLIYHGRSMGVAPQQIGFAALAYLLWLIPFGAAYMAYKEWRRQRSQRLEQAVGVASIMALGYVIMRIALSHRTRALVLQSSTFNDSNLSLLPAVELGIAAIVVPICGIVLLILSRHSRQAPH